MRNRHGVYLQLKTSSNTLLFSMKVRRYFRWISFTFLFHLCVPHLFLFFAGVLRKFVFSHKCFTDISNWSSLVHVNHHAWRFKEVTGGIIVLRSTCSLLHSVAVSADTGKHRSRNMSQINCSPKRFRINLSFVVYYLLCLILGRKCTDCLYTRAEKWSPVEQVHCLQR